MTIETKDTERAIWIALRDAHDALLIVANGDSTEGLVDAAGFQELVAGAALQWVKEALNLHLRNAPVVQRQNASRGSPAAYPHTAATR